MGCPNPKPTNPESLSNESHAGSTQAKHYTDNALDQNSKELIAEYERLAKMYVSLLKPLLTGVYTFDVKPNGDLNHHYGNLKAQPNPIKTIRINKELRAMAQHLPCHLANAVLVRYDESNIDFLRAMLFGTEDTPYAHGCFLFDLFLGEYPTNPPKVNLLTTGRETVRFNPNLYADGKVCLSLLGTWAGQSCETWSAKSSITQVLLSIQSLVMTDNVYGNEPGYEVLAKTSEGKLLNEGYCNIVKYANIKYAMIEQIKNPPKGFEPATAIHFYLKKDLILRDVKKWVDAASKTKANYTGLTCQHNSALANTFSDNAKFVKLMSEAYGELATALKYHKLRVAPTINLSEFEEEKTVEKDNNPVEEESKLDNTVPNANFPETITLVHEVVHSSQPEALGQQEEVSSEVYDTPNGPVYAINDSVHGEDGGVKTDPEVYYTADEPVLAQPVLDNNTGLEVYEPSILSHNTEETNEPSTISTDAQA